MLVWRLASPCLARLSSSGHGLLSSVVFSCSGEDLAPFFLFLLFLLFFLLFFIFAPFFLFLASFDCFKRFTDLPLDIRIGGIAPDLVSLC